MEPKNHPIDKEIWVPAVNFPGCKAFAQVVFVQNGRMLDWTDMEDLHFNPTHLWKFKSKHAWEKTHTNLCTHCI